MRFMLRSFIALCLLVSSVACHAQLNSGQDIKWPVASCTSSTLYYSPFDNQCHSISGVGAPVNSLVETSSYTVIGSGEFIQMNCASACTLTLPATITTGFTVAVMRTGAGALTINPNGVAYDGVTTGLLQDSSLFITTDGTGYHSTSPVTSYSGCTVIPSLTGSTLTCAGGSSNYFAQTYGTPALFVTNVTISPTPLAGSLSLAANGAVLRPGADFTYSGGLLTLTAGVSSGVVLTGTWASATSSTGSFTFDYVTILGSAQSTGALSSYVVTLPAGSASGDTTFLSWTGTCAPTAPSGTWTTLQSDFHNYYQAELSHVLTSGDVTSGTITVPTSCTGGYATAIILVMNGTHALREQTGPQWGCALPGVNNMSTTSGVLASDTLLILGSAQATQPGSIASSTGGIVKQQYNDTGPAVALFTVASPSAGVNNTNLSYSSASFGTCEYATTYVYE